MTHTFTKKISLFFVILFLISLFGFYETRADESAMFTSVSPDALIVLDLSGSMNWTPAGAYMYISSSYSCGSNTAYYGEYDSTHPKACYIDAYGTVPKWSDGSCSGPFYRYSQTGYETDCSRLAIAKRAIFDILDDNDDDELTSDDESTLNVRFGFMRFKDGNDTEGNYSKGNVLLEEGIGTQYADIWTAISGFTSGNGGTALVSSLNEAKIYLDYHKSKDAAEACRDKFVILITDGADTYACSGNGSESQSDQYKRRRDVVEKAKALADAGYKVFVVGFGAQMPARLANTLNWAAYFGNTDNPLVTNSGDVTAYDPDTVTACETSTTTTGLDGYEYANSNDPGSSSLSGYAFIASSAAELSTALKQAINIIRESTYSFTMSSIQTSRTTDENHLYEASFEPVNNDPFWLGHLKKYAINTDGTIGSMVWDAGSVLQGTDSGSRTIYTYLSSSLTAFTTSNISAASLELTTDTERDAVLGYLRGETLYNPDDWKLGDIFHSTPITIATPSIFYADVRDTNAAFDTFRSNNVRTSSNGKRTIVIGANDGQLHAFRGDTGVERWSFIPPNLLGKLKNIAHSSHPTGLTHQFFVDGPITVADVWLGSGDGTAKSASDWKTLLMFGEGRGAIGRLWSSSSSRDSGISDVYDSTYPYYAGYYCLDVTNPLSPTYKWSLTPSTSESPYLGDPWNKIMPGRVIVAGNEKWVGFLGGGYNAASCSNLNKCDSRGKGFFIIDLNTGNTLWSCTLADDSDMIYSIPGTAAIVDTDNDSFIDTVYIGDLGGNIWRIKLCRAADGTSCTTTNWSATMLFDSSSGVIRPIYTTPAVSRDTNGNLWVYWGSGDKVDPTSANAQEKFYAVKDNDLSTTYELSDLENITTGTYEDSSSKHGWYINLAGQGEKILAEPTVFGGVVYFTTFTPDQSGDPCSYGGDAKLYGVDYTTGEGILTDEEGEATREITIGTGIPTAPVISLKPGTGLSPDLYVTVSSSGGGSGANTIRVPFDPPSLANRTNMLYWHDLRLQ